MSFNTENIERLTIDLSADPFNPQISFDLAEEYRSHEQLASSVSFYLRCIEYGHETHREQVYTSLLRLAEGFETQKDRQWTVSNAILQAISYAPERPEAWFYLSRYYERQQQWQESYTYASVGLKYAGLLPPLKAQTDYLGKFCLEFQLAVAGWWVCRKEESRKVFEDLMTQSIPQHYKDSIKYNMERI